MPEDPLPSQLVQHVIMSADGGQSTGQVLYAQGRNSEGYIVYGPSPPENQAQVYIDHNIPESDQTVITQEPLGNMQAESEQVMPVPEVQQVIVEQIASQETLVEVPSNVTRIMTQDGMQNNVLTFDNGQVLSNTNGHVLTNAGVMTNDSIQEIDLTVKQEGHVTQITAQPQVAMPLTVVQLQQPVTTSQELDLTINKTSAAISLIQTDNSIPAKKRKYIQTLDIK